MTFIDAPRSNMADSKRVFPITQGIVKLPGSLHLRGNFRCNTAETFSLTLTTSLFEALFLVVHSSFRNLAYLGTCLIASRSGMLTCTFLNVSRMSLSLSSFFDCINLRGKGALVGMELEVMEFEPNLPLVVELGCVGDCGNDCSILAEGRPCSFSSNCIFSSSF